MKRNAKTQGVRIGRTVTCVTALVALAAAQAAAVEPPPTRKMTRQIEVMERIIDQVLLDSPNFLIRSTPVVRGTYLPETGVLFTFDASLVEHDWDGIEFKNWNFGKGFRVEERDGKRVIIIDDEPDEDEIEREVEDSLEEWRTKRRERTERVYVRGKTEMVDVLLDYGDTVTLDSNQWVVIMGFLTDEDFIDRNRFSRLILKAKAGDLEGYASGKISEEEMVKRIVEAEY
ncbi:MAG TPA: hypothetical protein VKU85_18995 [bacterium]|nr:hypothetical protein [bacterium]